MTAVSWLCLLGLLLDLGNLLPLQRGRRDLHAEDDVADLDCVSDATLTLFFLP